MKGGTFSARAQAYLVDLLAVRNGNCFYPRDSMVIEAERNCAK
jgi:hypothetical protein